MIKMSSQPIVIHASTKELKTLVDKAVENSDKDKKTTPSLSSNLAQMTSINNENYYQIFDFITFFSFNITYVICS